MGQEWLGIWIGHEAPWWVVPPRDISQCMETYLNVTSGTEPNAISGLEARSAGTPPQCPDCSHIKESCGLKCPSRRGWGTLPSAPI